MKGGAAKMILKCERANKKEEQGNLSVVLLRKECSVLRDSGTTGSSGREATRKRKSPKTEITCRERIRD